MSAPTEVTPPGGAPVAYSDPGTSALATIREAIGRGGMLIALLIVVVFFQITTNGVMLKSLNVTNVFLQNGYILVMALGMLLVIVIGHIDLSVGSVAGFLGAITAVLMVGVEVPVFGEVQLDPLLAVAVTLIAGGLIGVWQGWWIAYLRVPSFIVTLARDAPVPRRHAVHAGRPAGRPVPGELPGDLVRLRPGADRHDRRSVRRRDAAVSLGTWAARPARRRRPAQPDHAAPRRDPERGSCLPRLARPGASRSSTGSPSRPWPSSGCATPGSSSGSCSSPTGSRATRACRSWP